MRRSLRIIVAAICAALIFFVAAVPAWAMTLTFVRHAESQSNADGVIDTSVPGPGLSPLGQQHAEALAPVLAANGYDGFYVSSMLRTQQTAQPLMDLLGTQYEILPGLREISAGIFEGSSEDEGLGRLGYALAPIAWLLGARFVPILGGEDGNAFDARVDGALQHIYANGDENAVAFSHGATIMFWTMMNVDNPDLGLLLSHQLGNTEQVVIEGSPEDGWTLVSWAGIPVAAEPSLPIELFVNVRNLMVAPQTALYDIGQAFATGDIGALANAVRDGIINVARTVIGFVPDMVTDIVDSVGGADTVTVDQQPPAGALTGPAEHGSADDEPTVTRQADDAGETETTTVTTMTSRSQKSNGATDLTDGNKAEPGEKPTGTENRSADTADDEAADDVTEATEDAADSSVDNEEPTDGGGTETGTTASQQEAA
ncbi:histidine phosphatase family protein [Mycobacterium sp. B14F4]|uniref:histidine phosphatase family protein n=1 Tax=Mycobacterium sp. B14F4 TaxID=3153565 RepID=UPI00325E6FB1